MKAVSLLPSVLTVMSDSSFMSGENHDQRLATAVDAYFEALQRGEEPTPNEWAARFPELRDELGECLTALALIRQGASGGRADASRAGGAGSSVRDLPERSDVRDDASAAASAPALPGHVLLERIGCGGMGVVYKAFQVSTKRPVAVKFLAGELHASGAARRRFEREVELAAALDHPGIVRVLESGATEGQAYCVMEFVDGPPLHHYLATHQLALTEKLELFIQITEAVQHAHHRAVVHRDLKPANILVLDGQPKILDFGLARLLDLEPTKKGGPSSITRTGQFVGTLPYLSPEQSAGEAGHVDVRSDLYTLGVILFELLTGRQPYDTSGALAEALHNICHVIPPRPSHFCQAIKSDLDAVVLKALEKSKEKRYQTAAALADDLRCYLRGEPVEANRTTRFFLFRKAYARHRRQVQAAAAAFTFVLASAIAILLLYLQVRQERNIVRDERNHLQEQLHVNRLRQAAAHQAAGHDQLAEDLILGAYRECPDRRAYWSLVSFYARNPLAMVKSGLGWVTCAAFSPDKRYLAFGNLDGLLWLYFVAEPGRPMYNMHAHETGVRDALFTSNGRQLVTAGADGTIKFWVSGTWHLLNTLEAHRGGVASLRVSTRADRMLSTGEDGKILLWDVSSGNSPRVLATFEGPLPNPAADISADGLVIAMTTAAGTVRLVDAATGAPRLELHAFARPVEAVRISPNLQTLAVWSFEGVSLWDAASGTRLWEDEGGLAEPRPTSLWDYRPGSAGAPPTPHLCWTPTMDFSFDGRLLVASGWDATVRVWDARTGRRVADLRANATAVYDVAFAPQSLELATGSVGALRLWNLAVHPGVRSWPVALRTERACVAISNNGLLAWAGEADGSVNLIDLRASDRVQRWQAHAGPVQALVLDRQGRYLATTDDGGNLTLWRLVRREAGLSPHTQDSRISVDRANTWSSGRPYLRGLAFSPDGALLASGASDGSLDVWDLRDLDPGGRVPALQSWAAHAGLILSATFSPDGRQVLTGGNDWCAKLWELGRLEPISQWRHREWVNAVAFSPDGGRLASGSADLTIRIGRAEQSTDPTAIEGAHAPGSIGQTHAHWVNALVFLDAGRVLASGGNDAAIRFWDADTGNNLAALPSQGGAVLALAATDDGRWLAVGAANMVQLIDLGYAATLAQAQKDTPAP